ncbi:hypothetical protein EPUL_000295 [Erysiphe pulchra]|uniref:Uncharacterized protein n=1 Tax=Erysiphe pulchra TaxID=225359 RepID=A0A2S4Q1A9_9PEZI|nr:hypothetical protein EPUL_000295 [Erysiphe pulchra]
MIKEGAVNLHRAAGDSSLPVTERERKIRFYIPDFFPRSEAEKPDGPFREASCRNQVSIPQEWKLKYAGKIIYHAAWPVRMSLEMDEDFTAAGRSILKHSLDWASAGESSLQFARRLRKAVKALPADLILVSEVRDIQQNHIQQSLPRTCTSIERDVSSMSNDKLADHVVQVTEGIERWTLEDQVYKKSQDPKSIPLVTYES